MPPLLTGTLCFLKGQFIGIVHVNLYFLHIFSYRNPITMTHKESTFYYRDIFLIYSVIIFIKGKKMIPKIKNHLLVLLDNKPRTG